MIKFCQVSPLTLLDVRKDFYMRKSLWAHLSNLTNDSLAFPSYFLLLIVTALEKTFWVKVT